MNNFSHKNLLDLEFSAPFVRGDLTADFSATEKSADEKYVIFLLNEEIYAVSAEYVAEVIVPLPVAPLPKTPEWILGIANLRGKIIFVVDLVKFWKKKPANFSAKSKLIVLKLKNDNSQIAFAVDKLSEIVVLSNKDIESGGENSPDFCDKIRYKSDAAHLLDADKLFSALKIKS